MQPEAKAKVVCPSGRQFRLCPPLPCGGNGSSMQHGQSLKVTQRLEPPFAMCLIKQRIGGGRLPSQVGLWPTSLPFNGPMPKKRMAAHGPRPRLKASRAFLPP